MALFSTMMEAHDARYIQDHDFVRTIPIQTMGVQATDFDLSEEKKTALFDSGVAAAKDFCGRWDFEDYKKKYRRTEKEESRRVGVWG